MYDAIIVGGRCAGSPLAMLLARAGHKVLIVDRTTFPSDTMSTHFIQAPGMMRLSRWGLMADVFATNCPPIRKSYFNVSGEEMEFDIPLHESLPGLACPRRHLLDKILVDAAVAAGAELAERVFIDSLIREGERVVGVQGHTSHGQFEKRALIVIGADGRNSVVAREAKAPLIRFVDPLTSGYYTYVRNADVEEAQTYFHHDLMSVVFPTNDGTTLVALLWPPDRFPEIRTDKERHFGEGLQHLGARMARVRNSERAERLVGYADLANYIRKATGPGWALVGDALYHKDPMPGDGISDAFRGADLLAETLDDILSGNAEEESALNDYEGRQIRSIEEGPFDTVVRCANFELSPQERSAAFLERRLADGEEAATLL